MARIAINGFGRIGRCVVRAAIERGEKDLEFVSINDLTDTKTLAHLLKYDSVHGVLAADVKATEKGILVNGKEIEVTAIKVPANLPHQKNKVDLVLECTGLFTEREKAEGHLKAGAKKVLISRAGEGPGHHGRLRRSTTTSYDPAKHNDHLERVLHDELPRAGREGPARELRHQARPDDDDPLLHERPEHPRPAAQGPAPRARRGAVDDPDDDRRREGGRRGPPRAQGQARRHRDPRADAERLARRSHRRAREAGDRRGDQRRVQEGRRGRAQGHPRVLRGAARVGRLQRQPALVDLRRDEHPRHRRHVREGLRLVRQRVGLLEPHGRPGEAPRRSSRSPVALKTIDALALAGQARLHPRRLQRPARRAAARSPTTRASARRCRRSSTRSRRGAQDHPRLAPRPPEGQADDRRSSRSSPPRRGSPSCSSRTSSSPTTASATARRSSSAICATARCSLLENLRFHPEEEKNDEAFARELAASATST